MVYQLGRLAPNDPPSDSSCRPDQLLDTSLDASFHIGSSFRHFFLLIRIVSYVQNVLVIVIFLDLVVDGSLFAYHKVFCGCVDVRIHELIGMMIQLMLILLLELEMWNKPPPHLKKPNNNLLLANSTNTLSGLLHYLYIPWVCIYTCWKGDPFFTNLQPLTGLQSLQKC